MIRFYPEALHMINLPEDLLPRFREVRELIENLCIKYEVPIPIIGMARATDECDFTSPEEIRLNVIAAGDQVWDDAYPHHVFGHYLANVEQTYLWSDRVADLIGEWSALPTNVKKQLEHPVDLGPVEFECEIDDADCGRDDCPIHNPED
jgi:hypothetical protein